MAVFGTKNDENSTNRNSHITNLHFHGLFIPVAVACTVDGVVVGCRPFISVVC